MANLKRTLLRLARRSAALLLLPVVALTTVPTASATPRLTVIYTFALFGDGNSPQAALIVDATGALIGTTYAGGDFNVGTAFKLAPSATGRRWKKTELRSFGNGKGDNPAAALIAGPDGTLYGTTEFGGAFGKGTVFSLTPPPLGTKRWKLTVLHSFAGTDGERPVAGLIMDAEGALYGTTRFGGTAAKGTVFRLTPPAEGETRWKQRVLHSFLGGTDGEEPYASLIADQNGVLYGTTFYGGASSGTVFKLAPPAPGKKRWKITILHSFSGNEGNRPYARLVAGPDGTLYGTTYYGGTAGDGTVFSLTPPQAGLSQWTLKTLYDFAGGVNGARPYAGLIRDQAGALFGTTYLGGASDMGTVFRLRPPVSEGQPWKLTVLHHFAGGNDGERPAADLVADAAGVLYGNTVWGGAENSGVVYKVTGSGFLAGGALAR